MDGPMKNIRDKVKALLIEIPATQDSDNYLVSVYWLNEMQKRGDQFKMLSAMDFLLLYKYGELTQPNTLTRLRRQIQESCPELRGKNYTARQTHKQTKAKSDLGYE